MQADNNEFSDREISSSSDDDDDNIGDNVIVEALQGCSISEFNDHVIELLGEDDQVPPPQYYRALNLALTGKDMETGVQYSIEPIRNRFTPPREVTIVRDYDSLIAFTDWIPITANLFLYPVSNPADTLTSNLHLKVPMKIHHDQVFTFSFILIYILLIGIPIIACSKGLTPLHP
jgi:hypothetical protein